jgi:hypothetical protein
MKMRTQSCLRLLMVCFVLFLSGTWAPAQQAQQPKIAHANIPFQFWIGDSRLPAGNYEIQHVESATLVMFRSQDGHTVQDAYMIPLDVTTVKPDEAKLVFRIDHGSYYLYELWGVYGKRMLTSESALPAPTNANRLNVAVVYR